jgi:hypothetical protein
MMHISMHCYHRQEFAFKQLSYSESVNPLLLKILVLSNKPSGSSWHMRINQKNYQFDIMNSSYITGFKLYWFILLFSRAKNLVLMNDGTLLFSELTHFFQRYTSCTWMYLCAVEYYMQSVQFHTSSTTAWTNKEITTWIHDVLLG